MSAPKVIKSWLRFDDVECTRCHRWAGPEGERCYVVDREGVVCGECITEAEKARAVEQS